MTRCVHDMEENTCAICLGQLQPPPKVSIHDQRAQMLFDFAADHPRWTKTEAAEYLGCSAHCVALAVGALRMILADDDINVVTNYEDGDWYYKLVGDLDSAMPWAARRLHSVESQLNTIASVTTSICNNTNPKSREGKKARLIQAQIGILQLQLASIEG